MEQEMTMTHRHQLTTIEAIKAFVTAGNARFTLVSRKTGARFTYRARRPGEGKPTFVQVLTGADNENAYEFLGTIFADGSYRHGGRSRIAASAPSAKAWEWFFNMVADGRLSQDLEVWHEGRCGRCGRALTVPESIATGFGPECAGIVGKPIVKLGSKGQTPIITGDEFGEHCDQLAERKQEERGFLSDPDFLTYAARQAQHA